MTIKLTKFDAAEYLDDKETQDHYIQAALNTNDPARIKQALSTIIRARGLGDTAAKAGMTRQGLSKALSEDGDPKLSTLMGLFGAIDFKFSDVIKDKKRIAS